MNSKKVLLVIFIIVALVQLYVPARTVLTYEEVLAAGEEYKFKVTSIDQGVPFRGKNIVLHYDERTIKIKDGQIWTRGESIYVLLRKDSSGFAKILEVSKEKPEIEEGFVIAKVGLSDSFNKTMTIDYSFDKYYIEESKEDKIKLIYKEAQQDTSLIYALVNIKNGESTLKDVMINDISIGKIAKEKKKSKE